MTVECSSWRPQSVARVLSWILFFHGASSSVLPLVSSTFEDAIREHNAIVVQFFAPWCHVCKSFQPDYERAAGFFLGRVPFTKVDATVETDLADSYGIEGYPTLLLFRHTLPEEYMGERNSDSIITWVEASIGPALRLASEADIEALLQERRSVPHFVARGGERMRDICFVLAEEHRHLATFIFIEASVPLVQLHRGRDEVAELKHGAMDRAALEQFLMGELLPEFGEINERNFEGYLMHAEHGLVWVCFDPSEVQEEATRNAEVFRKVARSFSKFPVVFPDTRIFVEHVKDLGCTSFPTVVLQLGNLTRGEVPRQYRKHFRDRVFDADTVSQFLVQALDGRIAEDDGLGELDEDDIEDEDTSGSDARYSMREL